MKNLFVIIFAATLCFACKNTPAEKAPAATESNTAAAPPVEKIDPAVFENAKSVAKNNLASVDMANKILAEVPAKVKKEKSAEIGSILSTLGDMAEKQKIMNESVAGKTANDAEPAMSEKEYVESVERYAKDIQMILQSMEKLKSGGNEKQ